MPTTTLWIGPCFRQRADLKTYHGYGIQDFLEVDPRFGTRKELRDLVDAAHAQGVYVILDIIYNHTGNNWFYDEGFVPGSNVEIRESQPAAGQLKVALEDDDRAIAEKAAQGLYVRVAA